MAGEYTGNLCTWMGAANQTWLANGTAFSFSDPDECAGGTVIHYPADRVLVKDGEWRRVVGSHADACLERMERARTVQAALDRPVSRHGYKHQDANSKTFNDHMNLRWNLTYHLWQVGGFCAYYRIRVSPPHMRIISVAARLAH